MMDDTEKALATEFYLIVETMVRLAVYPQIEGCDELRARNVQGFIRALEKAGEF